MRSRIAAPLGRHAAGLGYCTACTLVAALVATAGCYWSKYDKLLRTHVDLLAAMATKIDDVTARDGVPPSSLEEYRYPLLRARDFARIAARRFEGRPSLAAFRTLCDAYERLLVAADSLRASSGDPSARDAFAAALGVFRGEVQAVRASAER